ncbi:MAG: class 1b ribonucleoside-diphosphate reductase subunit alpha [Defluviitaleaceae bacterium]|nr:class 1b ribonucleoside-diphosphate reductase subunit alpha [Defluviitaleaceae bacterium]
MLKYIIKRDGLKKDYNIFNIENAIFKAMSAVGSNDRAGAIKLSKSVENELLKSFTNENPPTVEDIQDEVEAQIMKAGYTQLAKAYILYRAMRSKERRPENNYLELNSEVGIKKDGFFQIEKDSLALEAYLKEIDNKKLKFENIHNHLSYLIDNEFYEDFYEKYSRKAIEKAYNILKDANFRFSSFISASKFFQSYAMKTKDKAMYLEGYEERILATALHVSCGDENLLYDLCNMMIKQHYQPATPTFLNSGKVKRGELVSCFLLEIDDSLNSISFGLSTSMYLSKIGGGVALNLSKLRSRGEPIKEIENVAKGVVPVLKLLEDAFNYADQMGQRKGAGSAYLNIFHSDIEEFLDTKKINADEKSRIQSLSLGITVPSKFFDLARDNEPYYVFYPYTVYKTFGKHLDEMDMSEMYDVLVANSDVRKRKLDAREMLNTIAKTQFESGYPYIIYIDNANKAHPLKDIGKIKMSNLCTEIFQLQSSTKINNYNEEDDLGNDISCVLGSINIVNVIEDKDIKTAVKTGTRALTNVSDLMKLENAPSIQSATESYHAIGLGAMNLHGFLTKNMISYESEEAKDFANIFFMAVNFYSIQASMEISKERKKTFANFEKSEYANGNYFEKYLQNDFVPKEGVISKIFEGIEIPTKEDWKILKEDVAKYGMYNAYRLAIAPTQSISYIQNSTPSIMPVIDPIEIRTYADSTTYYPMPFLSKENQHLYTSAYFMDQYKILDLVATIQQHIDQGISTVIYATNMNSTKDLMKLYIYAHKIGLKSLYYTRTKNLTIEECIACSV